MTSRLRKSGQRLIMTSAVRCPTHLPTSTEGISAVMSSVEAGSMALQGRLRVVRQWRTRVSPARVRHQNHAHSLCLYTIISSILNKHLCADFCPLQQRGGGRAVPTLELKNKSSRGRPWSHPVGVVPLGTPFGALHDHCAVITAFEGPDS